MIRITESLQLAKTKFKTRKVRNTLSAITVSLGIILILAALFATEGVTSLAKQGFKDSNADRYFLRDSGSSFLFISENSMADNSSDLTDVKTIDDYKKKVSGDFKAIYEEYTVNETLFSPSAVTDQNEQLSLYSVEDFFIKDYLVKDYTFNDAYEGKIPLIVPREIVFALDKTRIPSNSKESYDKTAELFEKYAGATISLKQLGYSPKDRSEFKEGNNEKVLKTEFIIVGFNASTTFSRTVLDNAFVIPKWAITDNTELKDLFSDARKNIIVEVSSKKERDTLFNKYFMDRDIFPITGKAEAFTEPVRVMKKVALGIGGFLLAISSLFVLSTLSKIVADSKREIGVFRAVGGQRKDIRKIFFSYTFLLVSLGYIVGFIISSILVIIASKLWGDDIFYSIAGFATNVTLEKPLFAFWAIPWFETLMLYAFVLLVGFLAALIPVMRASRLDPIKALREE